MQPTRGGEDETEPDRAPSLPGVHPSKKVKLIEEPVTPIKKLIVQFFLIPIAIVLLCVSLVFIFRWLTWEKQDLSTYLAALSSGSRPSASKEQEALKLLHYIQEAKRWQSIYDVTQQLRFNRDKFLAENPEFSTKIARIFQQLSGKDPRVRQYLAQVLGLVGGNEALTVLISALEDSDAEMVIHSMIALGRIGDPSAIPGILSVSHSDDRGLRQTAIFVLGNFKDTRAMDRCAETLNDLDPLVSWNATFALARQRDLRAFPMLERFLDEEYVFRMVHSTKQDPGSALQPDRLEQYRVTAIHLLGQLVLAHPKELPIQRIQQELQQTAANDHQVKVRQAAIEVLKKILRDEKASKNIS